MIIIAGDCHLDNAGWITPAGFAATSPRQQPFKPVLSYSSFNYRNQERSTRVKLVSTCTAQHRQKTLTSSSSSSV